MPLNSRETLTDVCIALEADVILVVGMKLGCLNHALLTVAGVWIRPFNDLIYLMPALVIGGDDLRRLTTAIGLALDSL